MALVHLRGKMDGRQLQHQDGGGSIVGQWCDVDEVSSTPRPACSRAKSRVSRPEAAAAGRGTTAGARTIVPNSQPTSTDKLNRTGVCVLHATPDRYFSTRTARPVFIYR